MTAVVLGGLWVLWPVIALAGGLGFSVSVAVAAVLVAPIALRTLRVRPYIIALCAFFAYAGVSSTWSPRAVQLIDLDLTNLQVSIRSEMLRVGLQILALGILIGGALKLDERAKARLQAIAQIALLVQLAMLGVLAVFETQILQLLTVYVPDTSEGVQNITRNCLIMAAAAVPLAIGLARNRSFGVGLLRLGTVFLILGAALIIRDVKAGLLAVAAATGAMAIVHLLPRIGFKLLGIGVAGFIMSAPWLFGAMTAGATYEGAVDSATHRAAIWQHVIGLINEHPVTGLGLGALRTMKEPIGSGLFAGEMMIPNHPHNMLLQLWAETGAIGAGLFSFVIVLAGWRMPDQRKLGASGLRAAALVGAMVAITAVYFDLWNEWWWAVGGLLAVFAVVTPATVASAKNDMTMRGMTFGGSVVADQTSSPSSATVASTGGTTPQQPLEATQEAISQFSHVGNNFNLLRLLFALLVVICHAIALPGFVGAEQAEAWAVIGADIAVQGFFVLSGYLVYASLERSHALGLYAEKRARRLLPGYFTVVIVCAAASVAFVPAARADLAVLGQYLGWNLAFLNFMAPGLPGVFESHRFTDINGALWTLKIEVLFYLILPLLALVLRMARSARWIVFILIYLAAEAWRYILGQQGGLMTELSRQLPGQMSFFVTGMALYAWRDGLNWRSALAPFGIALLALSLAFPQAIPLRAVGLGIVAVWFAVGIPHLFDAARFGDLSYGLYIVHFPIIQCVVAAGLFAMPTVGFAIAGGASLAAALLLWWLVERPALRRDSAYRS